MSEARKRKNTKEKQIEQWKGFQANGKKAFRVMLAVVLLLDVHLGTGSKLDFFVFFFRGFIRANYLSGPN